jgi:uncharacterized membrane protein
MRHITLDVPSGKGHPIAEHARDQGALTASWWPVKDGKGEFDKVSLVIENRSVGPLLKKLEAFEGFSVLLYPHEVLIFDPPATHPPKELQDLQGRSPLEIFLLSLQSIGSWPTYLGYIAAGAVLTWIAFYTNSTYLLIAAMLIAPFAGPAMNVALATATGDTDLYRQSLARYFLGIIATTIFTGLLSFIFQQAVVTDLMTGVGHVSAAAALLPLVAGAAGAFNLIQSERSSLVSGTAVGMLVTASLAPPAALIGVAIVMQTWSLATNAVFQLVLQLVGINLGGSLVFRQRGLTPSLREYKRGKSRLFYISLGITIITLAALLLWQFTDPVRLERSSRATQATEIIREVIMDEDHVRLVSAEADFKSTQFYGENTLLADVYVECHPDGAGMTNPQLTSRLQRQLQLRLQQENPQIAPLINLVMLEPPPSTPVPPHDAGQTKGGK